jgi:hypothetical protein
MQAELLLATRNVTGAKAFLTIFKETSDFLETRRVSQSSSLAEGAEGLFYANNGANLLAPSFGGQGLPRGCLIDASCGTAGFPQCCESRGFSYLAGLTVTYSALLDRMIELEDFVYPNATRQCTKPNSCTTPLSACRDLWVARRRSNNASLPALLATMPNSGTRYACGAGSTLFE